MIRQQRLGFTPLETSRRVFQSLWRPSSLTGFTLIELLVTTGIIGLLSMITVQSFQQAQRQARDARRKVDMRMVGQTLEGEYDQGQLPKATTIMPLEKVDIAELVVTPRDPKGVSYQYFSDSKVYRIYLNLEQTADVWTTLYPSDHPDFNVAYSNEPGAAFIRRGIDYASLYRDWYREGTAIYANAAWRTATYAFSVPAAGDWTLGLATKNHGPDMYAYDGYRFKVYVRLDTQWPYDRGTILTPGTSQSYTIGSVNLAGIRAGDHTITFTWANDYCPGCNVYDPNDPRYGMDANLMIGSVTLRRTPK